jgi:hypothetical protein
MCAKDSEFLFEYTEKKFAERLLDSLAQLD